MTRTTSIQVTHVWKRQALSHALDAARSSGSSGLLIDQNVSSVIDPRCPDSKMDGKLSPHYRGTRLDPYGYVPREV